MMKPSTSKIGREPGSHNIDLDSWKNFADVLGTGDEIGLADPFQYTDDDPNLYHVTIQAPRPWRDTNEIDAYLWIVRAYFFDRYSQTWCQFNKEVFRKGLDAFNSAIERRAEGGRY